MERKPNRGRNKPERSTDNRPKSGPGNRSKRSDDGRPDRSRPGTGGRFKKSEDARPERSKSGSGSRFKRSEDTRPARGEQKGGGFKRRPRPDEEDKKTNRSRPTSRSGGTRSQKPSEYDNQPEKGPIRLNRYIANAGICSRRDADELIQTGQIKVNGEVVREMGLKVSSRDKVVYKGRTLRAEKTQYVLLNKPKDFITTMEDTHDRKTVMNLVDKACEERIYPVGRLDRHTTGLLLFTNDGELARRLTHPSQRIRKIYQIELDKPITADDFEKVVAGVTLDDGIAPVDELAIVGNDAQVLGIEIHVGRNRIVRRIFEKIGYRVEKLDRVMFGNLTKKDLPRGNWRHLSAKEIMALKGARGKKFLEEEQEHAKPHSRKTSASRGRKPRRKR